MNAEEKVVKELIAENFRLECVIHQLTKDKEDLNICVKNLTSAIRKAINDSERIIWGNDGSCGSGRIFNALEDVLETCFNKS